MPVTRGVNHVATLTSDMDVTVRFYERAFDATVVFEVPRRDDHPWMKVVDIGGGAALNVFEVPVKEIIGERRRQGGRGAIDHFALDVDRRETLDSLRTRLVEAGAQEVGEIQRLGHEWSLFFRDPDGMELEVCCPAEASSDETFAVGDALTVDDTLGSDDYDEFGLLHENAREWDIPWSGRPAIRRDRIELSSGQALSYIRWGAEEPELVFLHGGAQNAHTWDTVALALGRPAVAIDLPGHGHSDRRADRDYGPWRNAEVVAAAMDSIAPDARAVVGMSLGGATVMRLASTRPDLCRRVVIVDVTPQVNDPTRMIGTAERGTVALIGGPPTHASFDEMADAAIALSPLRAPEGVRRGVRHNAMRLADGRWTWRYDLFGAAPRGAPSWVDFTPLWEDVSAITAPVLFVRGERSPFVRPEDAEEMQRRLPSANVVNVEGAGHAVQSDRPLDLVRLMRDFVYG